MKIVENGKFQERSLVDALAAAGCRCLSDVVSDLKAQVAANQKGILLVKELIEAESLTTVLAYMKHIQNAASVAVRFMLRKLFTRKGISDEESLVAHDSMDDGSQIRLRIHRELTSKTTVFDFTESDGQVPGNTNAPPAITKSAVIYCLRCLVDEDIPLNQGCLEPVRILIPKSSLLDPEPGAGVVGGNVLTSQRITDVVLKAFGACAASQGCMNNLTFGDENVRYYETIAGGAGAGPSWMGSSAVHTHMTNTRITDAEILERRYPVQLVQFAVRRGSGGAGKFRGGDGVVREIQFKKPMTVSILSERRKVAPYGAEGGSDGARGENLWKHENGDLTNLGGKNSVQMVAGDSIVIMTPGGGGFGSV
eukprot:CAMPEP_0198332356 /NCGR_PEP_ID=MMETSP1450-20131203/18222_1 /TAXON_ID=753684 ORGANISM="Madagascaria erythrocladiodes, Strain CCMP3234" /NCGR_SAMPLE_ID=MMETSP1450 /ASSEMBLY_ACC=CAM_ASM_001115 /LENGTH=365 /DNA_ID=CAMNT_0044036799 /DNA_START=38 /DNA_END=1135 /DNA_ORIENTATION=+